MKSIIIAYFFASLSLVYNSGIGWICFCTDSYFILFDSPYWFDLSNEDNGNDQILILNIRILVSNTLLKLTSSVQYSRKSGLVFLEAKTLQKTADAEFPND